MRIIENTYIFYTKILEFFTGINTCGKCGSRDIDIFCIKNKYIVECQICGEKFETTLSPLTKDEAIDKWNHQQDKNNDIN